MRVQVKGYETMILLVVVVQVGIEAGHCRQKFQVA